MDDAFWTIRVGLNGDWMGVKCIRKLRLVHTFGGPNISAGGRFCAISGSGAAEFLGGCMPPNLGQDDTLKLFPVTFKGGRTK